MLSDVPGEAVAVGVRVGSVCTEYKNNYEVAHIMEFVYPSLTVMHGGCLSHLLQQFIHIKGLYHLHSLYISFEMAELWFETVFTKAYSH